MKLERLEISNFRGILGNFEIEPGGGNVVLVGPNGSGKSSVIAAVDFLLNGSVETLTGEGTGGISVHRHGPHVDADPDDSWVEADFSQNGGTITVRRSITDRLNPDYQPSSEEILDAYKQMEESADRGLHLLSRDEILRFINSQGQARSERIRSLLNVTGVKERRLVLNRAANHFEDRATQKAREIESIEAGLRDFLDLEIYSPSNVRAAINTLRAKMGGSRVESLEGGEFREGLDSPFQQFQHSPVLTSDGRQYVTELRQWVSEGIEEFLETDEAFRESWAEFDPSDDAIRAFHRQDLLELGKDSIDTEASQCPLCQEPWDPDRLRDDIDRRLVEADELSKRKDRLEEQKGEAQQNLTTVRVQIEAFLDLLQEDDRFDTEPLESYLDVISSWEDQYDRDLLETPPKYDWTTAERKEILSPDPLIRVLDELEASLADTPALEQLEEVWDQLEGAETRYLTLQETRELADQYQDAATQLRQVHESYLAARDTVLGDIYSDIESQFVDYYTDLHNDESNLEIDLSTTEAGLDLSVDFYDRGTHPPHALHSEGHQDSMGLCLHLALCDWLQEEEANPLIMLDDVVMSIDADHRKPLANLLGSEIAEEYQLLITTHDDLWHRHLRSEGVVTSQNAVRFVDWNIEEGPKTMDQPEMEWQTIYTYLEEGKVPSAAFQTRRMSEWFLREVCDHLDAKVRFDSDSNWTLGDFKTGAISRINDLLGTAKQAEQSWGNDISHLNELDEELSTLSSRLDQDGAALNPNVHWNETQSEFAHCSPAELQPAVEAYHDLYTIFWCETCDSPMSLTKDGHNPIAIRCRCGDINWNLQEKSR